MNRNRILTATAAIIAMLTVSMAGAAAEAKTNTRHRYVAKSQNTCPLRRTVNGDIVDCHGWRLRSNATGWDNSCLNLDYLPSMYACGSSRR